MDSSGTEIVERKVRQLLAEIENRDQQLKAQKERIIELESVVSDREAQLASLQDHAAVEKQQELEGVMNPIMMKVYPDRHPSEQRAMVGAHFADDCDDGMQPHANEQRTMVSAHFADVCDKYGNNFNEAQSWIDNRVNSEQLRKHSDNFKDDLTEKSGAQSEIDNRVNSEQLQIHGGNFKDDLTEEPEGSALSERVRRTVPREAASGCNVKGGPVNSKQLEKHRTDFRDDLHQPTFCDEGMRQPEGAYEEPHGAVTSKLVGQVTKDTLVGPDKNFPAGEVEIGAEQKEVDKHTLAVERMQADLMGARQTYALVLAEQRRALSLKERQDQAALKWERSADLAALKGDDARAKEALSRRTACGNKASDLQAQIASLTESLGSFSLTVEWLEERIAAAVDGDPSMGGSQSFQRCHGPHEEN